MVCPETSHFSQHQHVLLWGFFFFFFLSYVMRNSIWDIWSFSTIDSLNNRLGRDQIPDTDERLLIDFFFFLAYFWCFCSVDKTETNKGSEWFTYFLGCQLPPCHLWQCSYTWRHVSPAPRWFSKGRSSV